MEPLSIRQAYAGRHVLLTGASGFLGKVWLSMLLERVPDVGRIYVLLRPKALVAPEQRFEKMFNTSPAFRNLHERFGTALSEYVTRRVEVVAGDVADGDLGLEPGVRARLGRDLDLIVHCAGLVDFNPDLRKALASNVQGAVSVADFAASCDKAALVHVSTCYVAGNQSGTIEEGLRHDIAPNGERFCAEQEVALAWDRVHEIERRHRDPAFHEEIRREVEDVVRERRGTNGSHDKLIRSLTRRALRERLTQDMVAAGTERAAHWGWPNIYTYTKFLAEALLVSRAKSVPFTVVRPSIVESAVRFPFSGWNQGFNASAPLAYVMGTWFRFVPARHDAPFDVVPVDLLCNALTTVGAAILRGEHAPVYQLGTSDRNRISVGRAAELITLSHRRHLRDQGQGTIERVVLSRWDAVTVSEDHALSVQMFRELLGDFHNLFDRLPRRWPARLRAGVQKQADKTRRIDNKLDQIAEMVRLYMPFMHDNYHVFRCRAIAQHQVLEPEFRFVPEELDWRAYWLDVHMPGLRRWAFPLIENRKPEAYRARHPISLASRDAAPQQAEVNIAHASRLDVLS